MIIYYSIGGFCIDHAKSDVYERHSSLFKSYGIKSSDDIKFRFSFRDFLSLLVGFSIGQLLLVLCNGGLIGSILSLVPWVLGLEMATWPHKKIEAYIGRETFLGFDWPRRLDERLGLSTPWLTSNSSDEKWEECALEVIEKLKQYPGCIIGLSGLREDSSGNSFYLDIELSKYEEAEVKRSINRFFTSFRDGRIECSFYTSEEILIETLGFEGTTPPLE
jgi:hypothetical protein